ncbi:MAG TPA: carboxypeptidase-like regulatory domain-containing protein [Cyclobacteriaceae bacterium]|nr:carboxypeptidase-like regulatory domain-containing protein [Cyclobacteriaceae bacterium]
MIPRKKILLFSALLELIVLTTSAQNFFSLQGKVVDAKTKEALLGAAVFLAKTSTGNTTDEQGKFKLVNVPKGKYDLTVSMLGYKTISFPLLITATPISNYTFELEEDAARLNEVEVKAKKYKTTVSYYNEFRKHFLGSTKNADHCKILNPEDIVVYKDDYKLIALAKKPIEVTNNALGYKIFYSLIEFEFNWATNNLLLAGVTRFEELTPNSESQRKEWEKKRRRAYYGSIVHFLKSLRNRELNQNLFFIDTFDVKTNATMASSTNNLRNVKANGTKKMKEDILMRDSSIVFSGGVLVMYEGEKSDEPRSRRDVTSMAQRHGDQISTVYLTGTPVTIYSNGYFDNYHEIFFQGYFGWSSAMAEQLPLDYKPNRNSQK